MINPYSFGVDGMNAPVSKSTSGAADASDLRYLEDRVDRLSLICMAMWSLMQDKTNLSEQDLMDRVKMIDLMDGKEDGKATRTVTQAVPSPASTSSTTTVSPAPLRHPTRSSDTSTT